MLVPQRSLSGGGDGQGCLRATLAELQQPSSASQVCEGGLRQRLLVLAQRLERVQALGNECSRVAFSEHAQAVLAERAHVV